MDSTEIEQYILEVTQADGLVNFEKVQSLWSGYGSIVRMGLEGTDVPSVIVKHVQPENGDHPRGWNTDLSHKRKLKSYQVETAWYREQMQRSPGTARIPKCLGVKACREEVLLVLEDLDAAGFAGRRRLVSKPEWQACVKWLADFHADYLGQNLKGLWKSGTYWHLETRPDELEELKDKNLKAAAQGIDAKLKSSPFQTLVHGDAKLANFCFNEEGSEVAAVDFQYVGGGCGMKDLAYFVGSCFRDEEAEEMEEEVLDLYFTETSKLLGPKSEELEADWRPLYRVAWADFHRFLKGWSPGHWKLSDYSERVTREVIESLHKERE